MVNPQWGNFLKPMKNQMEQDVPQVEEPQQIQQAQEIPAEINDAEINDAEKPEPEKPQWGNFQSPDTFQGEIDPNAEEGMFDFLTRTALDNTSRFVEKFAGGLGDTEKFAKDTLANVPNTGGYIADAISTLIGKDRWENMVRGRPGQEQRFPTTEMIKKQNEQIIGRSTKPRSSGEEKVQGLVSDVASVLSGKAMFGGVPNTRETLLIPAAANAVKEAVEGLGFGEEKAAMAKAAVWMPLMLSSNVNGNQYASNLMNRGREGLPQTLRMDVPRFTNRLDAVERNLLSADPRTALARQTLSALRNDVASGQTNSQSLLTMYDAVNAAKRNRGLFELPRGDRAFAIRSIDQVRHAVRDEIMEVGRAYPEALQNWQNGVTAWAVVHQSNSVKNYVQSLASGPYAKALTGPAAALFGVGSIEAIANPTGTAAKIAIGGALYKTGQILYRMWNDPNLARYYWGAVTAAGAESAPAFISNYNKLNEGLESKPVKNINKSTK